MKKKRRQNINMNKKKTGKKKKLTFNVQTNINMRKRFEANTKLGMKMNVEKTAKMKLNTMLQMGNSRYCCALAAKQSLNVWLCAGPYSMMSTAEAHLLTVSGDRDERCKW
jgi:hypothetical protein